MANARLKQARRRGPSRSSQAAQSVPHSPAQTQALVTSSPDASVAQDEPNSTAQTERDALEAALAQRKHALESQIQALTLGKPLHKDPEPGCDASGRRLARCHRDFLLQEMEWMAADFSQERKWRLRNAKMLSQTLVSHLDRQEQRLARRKKSEEVQRRRTAARVGRDVKKFWFKIDKIIAFKVKLQADELRQRHMQKHLKQLVEQTEKYSTALAKSFQEAQEVKKEDEDDYDEDQEDGDFEMMEEEEDDETTIDEEERRAGPVSRRQAAAEVTALQEEGDMPIEELRARYATMENGTDAGDEVENAAENSSSEDGDFELTEEEEDDETTIAAEERRSGPVSRRQAAAEVATLQEENELSIEELRARYVDALGTDGDEVPEADQEDDMEGGSDIDNETGDDDFVPTRSEEAEQEDDETTIEEEERLEGDASPTQKAEELRLLEEEGQMSVEQLRARYAAAASDDEQSNDHESLDIRSNGEPDAVMINREQDRHDDDETKEDVDGTPTSDTTPTDHLSARRSGYKRPFLLTSRLDLREYQEAGVNWLISMCERRINGILADEMGLGKTIQTISLLAHLACAQGLWGPHLIVVPTSCLVNWEMEFKRWCPAFKVLTYFGSAKRRKELRQGWSKQNAFQVCITSYQLVVQDAHCFKRKKWYYLILDEAHNIKNWKSLRWQTLLTFSSQRRLLLTGTPLQNNLLELWALMHFLMPHVFASRKEFSYWFQNPLALMVENGSDPTQSGDNGVEGGKDLVTQLHGIIRPFVLRRLKKDVAKQLPGKFEHVISCQLSKRQRFLYEDFISRSSTRRAMFGRGKGRGANFMSMMNVLMQLRKVCNHPDLFEPRPIESPLDMSSIQLHVPSRCGYLVDELVNERPRVALWSGMNLPGLELSRSEKLSSMRRRELFFYDVSAPLPDNTVATVPLAYEEKKDIVRRIMRLAAKRREYWEQKRSSISQLQKIHIGLYLDEPVFGDALIRACTMPTFISSAMQVHVHRARPMKGAQEPTQALHAMVRDPDERVASLQAVVNKAVCYVPKARASPARVIYGGGGFVYDDNFVLSRKAQVENLEANCAQPVASQVLAPYHNSFKRTQLFFPDKALVQFDCGKLQQLAVLLRTLKRGGHRCLIFTQMSSMLNILEVFLNLHGHTYFRLDGATKVDKRQMLMERFNRDEKVFCFILSTRSGGLGINLTGADAVIFYDSDWNPAMDAQAQDRAHRIGQTRDVHIYRLVSEHTVEENILRKAQQKRHLDFLVMSEGQFTTDFFSKASLRELMMGSAGEAPEDIESDSDLEDVGTDEDMDDDNEVSFDTVENAMAQVEDEEDVVAMKGARAEYLQEQNEFDEDAGGGSSVSSPRTQATVAHSGGDMTSSRPSTPSSVVSTAASERDNDEDDEFRDDATIEEDVGEEMNSHSTRRGTRRELVKHDGSDDDSIGDGVKPSRKRQRRNSTDQRKTTKRVKRLDSHGDNGKHGDKVRERARDAAEEQKLQAWKASVQSLQGFEDSLNPVDRYALHFREDVDPLYAYTPAQQAEALAGVDSNPDALTLLEDIEQTETEKREEETRLIAEGELVVGQMDDNNDTDPEQMTAHYTELYRRERAHVLFERRKRLLTGAAWSRMKCVNTGHPFYFNVDTREATWECPPVWVANEQLKSAQERGYEGLPPPALQRVMSMLMPFPERYRAQMVCRSWHTAAHHPSLFVKVSATDFDPGSPSSLAKVLARVAPGDTVLFGAGVYQLDETLEVSKSLRLLAAPDSRVELQMHSCRAQLRWSARGGVICGFHFSRTSNAPDAAAREINLSSDVKEPMAIVKQSRKSLRKQDKKLANWQHLLSVVGDGRLRVEYCEFDGNGRGNACVCVWGRGEKKKRRRKRTRGNSNSLPSTSKPATPLVGVSATSTPTAATPRVSAAAAATVLSASAAVKTNPVSTGLATVVAAATPAAPTVTPSASTVTATKPVASASASAQASPAARGMTPTASAPVSTITRISALGVSATIVPKIQTPISTSVSSTTPQGFPSGTARPRIAATPVATSTAATTKPAADTLLVLQNCRIRGAGTSGVLLVRGSLVMYLNTVESNAHSGVTVLGGQAILRRNKIQRNGRFGMRLLYHAGNVIVEDNVVSGNSCGNLDVDNSGRRFVVRLNAMDKGKKLSEKLPHSHGQLRLKTYRIVEKEVPRPAVNSTPTATNAINEYWKRQLTGAGASTTASASYPSSVAATTTTTTAASTSARPVMTSNGIMAAGIPIGFMRPMVFSQGSNPLQVSRLPMAFAPLGSKATIPSMTLNRSTTSAQLPGTQAALQRAVSVPAPARPVTLPGTTRPTIPGMYITSTSAVTTPSGSSALEPLKKRRKRRPKTQQVIVGGREIVLRDTCEKPTEKVVKPRRPKDPQTPTVLQQLTSPSALQLKFAPGSTAAAVAAAMSAMMANTAKLQAASSAAQIQASSSSSVAAKVSVPKPSVPVSFPGSSTPVATAKPATGATLAANTVSSKVATTVATPVEIKRTVPAATSTTAGGLAPGSVAKAGDATTTVASGTVPAVTPTGNPAVAKLTRATPAVQTGANSSTMATPTGTEPTKTSTQPGEKRKLGATVLEAKATHAEAKSAGSCKDHPETNASKLGADVN